MRTLFLLLLLCSFLNTTNAQVFVRQFANGNNDGTSWTDAYTNLQTALDSSEAGSQIWVASGIHIPSPASNPDSTRFESPHQYEIYGGFIGIETELESRDWIANPTILSGDVNQDDIDGDFSTNRTDNARSVFVSNGGTVPTILDGLSFVHGNGRFDEIPMGTIDFYPWIGAGVALSGESHIRNCTFSENAGFVGSGLFIGFDVINDFIMDNCTFNNNYSDLGTVRVGNTQNALISNTNFENNSALTFGGALVIGNGNASVEDCSFLNNSVEGAIGGGLFFFQNSGSPFAAPSVEVKRSVFEGNIAPIGAGLAFNNFFPDSQISIDSCSFTNNSANDPMGYGAGITLQNYEDGFGGTIPSLFADIQNTVIDSNASSFGTGLYLASFSDIANLDMENCLVEGNTATDGFAGVGIINSNVFVNVGLSNVTFEGNLTNGDGAGLGLFNASDDTPMQYVLDSCTFEGNLADAQGGAIWSSSPASNSPGPEGLITKTLFLENEGQACCGAIYSGGESLVIDESVFEGNKTAGADNNIIGGGAMAIDFEGIVRIKNSIFEENESSFEGAALLTTDDSKVFIENSLIIGNVGAHAITNQDSLWLTNVTMLNNDLGLLQIQEGFAQLQNTIFENDADNYTSTDSTGTIVSMGGNLSSDGTMVNALVGFGPYLDFNNTSSNLGTDNVPLETSVCVDTGNPDNILFTLDLAGVPRFQGVTLDIGAFESSFDTPIRELNALEINVYPNPFVSELQLSSVENINQIRLLDGIGKVVQVFPVENTLYVKSELAQGIYYLEVTIGGRTYFKKLNKG